MKAVIWETPVGTYGMLLLLQWSVLLLEYRNWWSLLVITTASASCDYSICWKT